MTRKAALFGDNVYGSIDEDVWRRDFTCNAPLLQHRGLFDLGLRGRRRGYQASTHRVARRPGAADARRPGAHAACRSICGQLDFSIDPTVSDAIAENVDRLANVPAARLFR